MLGHLPGTYTSLSFFDRMRLKLAGWHTRDEATVAKYRDELVAAGFKVNEAALVFLRNFGGLKFQALYSGNDFHFDPWYVVRRPDVNYWVKEYERFLKFSVCPVGEWRDNVILIAMGETGTFLAAYDNVLWKHGSNGEEGISSLMNLREGTDMHFVNNGVPTHDAPAKDADDDKDREKPQPPKSPNPPPTSK